MINIQGCHNIKNLNVQIIQNCNEKPYENIKETEHAPSFSQRQR